MCSRKESEREGMERRGGGKVEAGGGKEGQKKRKGNNVQASKRVVSEETTCSRCWRSSVLLALPSSL